MRFDQSDRREVETIISKLTTVGDASGKFKRDIRTLRLLNPQWPDSVLSTLASVESDIGTYIAGLEHEENRLINVINQEAPQE